MFYITYDMFLFMSYACEIPRLSISGSYGKSWSKASLTQQNQFTEVYYKIIISRGTIIN